VAKPTMAAMAYISQLCSKTVFKPIPPPERADVIPL